MDRRGAQRRRAAPDRRRRVARRRPTRSAAANGDPEPDALRARCSRNAPRAHRSVHSPTPASLRSNPSLREVRRTTACRACAQRAELSARIAHTGESAAPSRNFRRHIEPRALEAAFLHGSAEYAAPMAMTKTQSGLEYEDV